MDDNYRNNEYRRGLGSSIAAIAPLIIVFCLFVLSIGAIALERSSQGSVWEKSNYLASYHEGIEINEDEDKISSLFEDTQSEAEPNTLDGLNESGDRFNEKFRPYYALLTEENKQTYRELTDQAYEGKLDMRNLRMVRVARAVDTRPYKRRSQ